MLINWFTVIAQLVNFLILVWLLKRFLYKPILKAVEEREKKIAAQIEDAAKKEADAQKESAEYRQKNEAFDKEKDAMMKKAASDAEEERQRLLENARKDAGVLHEKLEKALKEEQQHIDREITGRAQAEVLSIARKTLKDLADDNIEDQIIKMFIRKLEHMDEEEKKKVAASDIKSEVVVKTAFSLTDAQQKEITDSVGKLPGVDKSIRYEVSPELIGGIELNIGGYKIAWSISGYLSSLEHIMNNMGETNNNEIADIDTDGQSKK